LGINTLKRAKPEDNKTTHGFLVGGTPTFFVWVKPLTVNLAACSEATIVARGVVI
jgi:hypothetical protein